MNLHFSLLKPFLLFSKFLFLFPHKDYWKVCDYWKICSIIAYVCFLTFEIIFIYSVVCLEFFNIYTAVMITFSCSLDILAICSHVTSFLFKKESVNDFLECIGSLYKKNCNRISINANFWSIISIFLFLIDVHNYIRVFFHDPWVLWCLLPLPLVYLIMYTILLQYIYFLDFLCENFQTLTGSIGKTEYTLLKQVEEHWHLIELCQYVNVFYSRQLLFGLTRIFVTLTIDSFDVVDMINKYYHNPENSMIAFLSITNSTWSLSMLLAVAHTSELAKEAAESFHSALSDVLKKNKTINNERLVMYLHVKPILHLNVYGFFSLGRHAISSVLGVVVTFLVILIQVSNP